VGDARRGSGEDQGEVARLSALFQAANRITIFLGPPIAGVLIATIGTARILYVDAATYLVSFALVLLFVHVPSVALPADERGILAGVRFIFRDRLLRLWTPAFTNPDGKVLYLGDSITVDGVGEYQ